VKWLRVLPGLIGAGCAVAGVLLLWGLGWALLLGGLFGLLSDRRIG